MSRIKRTLINGILVLALMISALRAQERSPIQPQMAELKEKGVSMLSRYLKIDTSNPPGNELEAIQFLASILHQEGIESEILESAPKRANLYARLKGNGKKPPIILVHHADVVPAEKASWQIPPFSGTIKEGYIHGRGSMDMKSLGIVQLMTLIALQEKHDTRERDVILLVTADEERGGILGMNWLVENHIRKFEDAEFALNEGGMNLIRNNRFVYVGVEIAQKTPLWIRLSVRGRTGHGAVPKEVSASTRLVRALNRILDWKTEIRIVPAVEKYLSAIAPFQPEPVSSVLNGLLSSADSAELNEKYSLIGPYFHSLTRNTVSLTVLKSGEVTNTIPSVAIADLDCRLLPGEDPEVFLSDLKEVIRDPAVQIEVLLSFYSSQAPENSEMIDAIRNAVRKIDPEAEVGISVLPGFTDSHILRDKGIAAYGFSPFRIEESEPTGAHSQDERISVEDFQSGFDLFYSVVADLVLE